jgi:hypothetical protein
LEDLILHLVQGDNANALLRLACGEHGIPGDVACIPEDLSHGPLQDGVDRLCYMRNCFRGYAAWRFQWTDAFEPWRELSSTIADRHVGEVCIWHGANGSDHVFVRMACWWLADWPGQLAMVQVSGSLGKHYLSLYSPDALARMNDGQRRLSRGDRRRLSGEFESIRYRTEPLRSWSCGRLRFLPAGCHDHWLTDVCDTRWQPAARVVGRAMRRCDEHNRLSDLFFSFRLQHLIDSGRLECRGERRRLRDYEIRLPER